MVIAERTIDIIEGVRILKENGVESFEGSGILVIPCSSPEEIYDLANKVRRIFKECGYNKSWQIDPYYYDRRETLAAQMYDT